MAGSFVIINKETDEAVLETFNKDILDKLNKDKYYWMNILEYLVKLNKN